MRIPDIVRNLPVGRFLSTLVFLLPFILLLATTQALKEYFPISNFPMYSSMGGFNYYVYLTDGDDNPVACATVTGQRTADVKKVFASEERRLRKILDKDRYELTGDDLRPAGRHTLNWLYDVATSSPRFREKFLAYDKLRIYRAVISIDDGKLRQPPAEFAGELVVADRHREEQGGAR